MAFPGEMHTNA